MSEIRRVNIFGGPGSGKSITAINIRVELGFKDYNIELVEEVVKDWTYISRIPEGCDDFYLTASQIQKEDIRLRAGVGVIVSDSPIFIQYFFSRYHNVSLQEPIRLASLEFEKLYPSLNIFLDRENKFYDEVGRYEKLKEAKRIDILLKATLVENKISFRSFSCLAQKDIIDYVESRLEAK